MVETIAFLVVFFAFLIYFIFTFFTKRGKLLAVKMIFASNETKEIAVLPTITFPTKFGGVITQEIKIYECLDKTQKYYVLETTHKSIGGISRFYTKLTPESLKQISSLN